MKIKNKFILFSILMTIIIGGCSANETKPELGTNVDYEKIQQYPKWVIQPTYENGIAGVGSAKMTDLGFDFARKEAMSSARVDLAAQIKTKVDNLFKSYATRTGIGESTSVDSLAENVTKELISLNLQGASLRDTWISPSDELFVLMSVDNDKLREVAENAINNSNNYNGGGETLKIKVKAKSSQDELQKELNDYFGNSEEKSESEDSEIKVPTRLEDTIKAQ